MTRSRSNARLPVRSWNGTEWHTKTLSTCRTIQPQCSGLRCHRLRKRLLWNSRLLSRRLGCKCGRAKTTCRRFCPGHPSHPFTSLHFTHTTWLVQLPLASIAVLSLCPPIWNLKRSHQRLRVSRLKDANSKVNVFGRLHVSFKLIFFPHSCVVLPHRVRLQRRGELFHADWCNAEAHVHRFPWSKKTAEELNC